MPGAVIPQEVCEVAALAVVSRSHCGGTVSPGVMVQNASPRLQYEQAAEAGQVAVDSVPPLAPSAVPSPELSDLAEQNAEQGSCSSPTVPCKTMATQAEGKAVHSPPPPPVEILSQHARLGP